MLQTAPWKGPCGKEPSANSHMSLEVGPASVKSSGTAALADSTITTL